MSVSTVREVHGRLTEENGVQANSTRIKAKHEIFTGGMNLPYE